MTDINQKVIEIEQFLDKQIKSINKTRNLTIITGLFILCSVVGYVLYINNILKKHVTDQKLSNIIAFYLSENITNASPVIEKTLLKEIPKQSVQLKQELLKSISNARVSGNEYLKKALVDIFNQVDMILAAEIKNHGSLYRMQLARQIEIMSNPESADQELQRLDIIIEKAIFEEVDKYLDFTLKELQNIENKIKNLLISKDNLTEEEKLIKTFIYYWSNFFYLNFEKTQNKKVTKIKVKL